MNRALFFSALLLLLLAVGIHPAHANSKPNVVVILADDLGYGDVRANNPERSKIPTPHLDMLANQGMRFTDAHTSSGVCSPSRYSLLTGRYHWRSRLQSGIVGYLQDPLIDSNRLTLPGMLKQNGYRTGMVGKWHLGWNWNVPEEHRKFFGGGKTAHSETPTPEHLSVWREYFSKPIQGGPTSRGFDEYFGVDVPNWPPYVFIENDKATGIPSSFLAPGKLQNHQASLQGPAMEGWQLETILPALGDRACAFIEKSAKQSQPFFLYLPLTSPHTPLAVNPEWRGKSGMNTYADFLMETDAVVGRVMDALERSGAAGETIVFFTSDNGFAPYVGAAELEAKGHFPSGPLRGYKADAWEGGNRVPFFVRWPGFVNAGTHCDALIQQTDIFATVAGIIGAKLPESAAEDSVSILPLLKGSQKPVREFAISHAASGLPAMRKGSWKIIFGQGGGGFGTRVKNGVGGQLYDLSTDLSEKTNLWESKPEVVAELTAAMSKFVEEGRSTPGAAQKNDVPVKWRRFLAPEKP